MNDENKSIRDLESEIKYWKAGLHALCDLVFGEEAANLHMKFHQEIFIEMLDERKKSTLH